MLTHQYRWHWKTPARLLRNGWWSLCPRISVGEWASVRADPREYTLWPSPMPGITVFKRDPDKYRYLARCPLIETGFYIVSRGAAVVGYFVLTFAPGQARIADAWTSIERIQQLGEVIRARDERGLITGGCKRDMDLGGTRSSSCGFITMRLPQDQ
jgi:hypothetical protein